MRNNGAEGRGRVRRKEMRRGREGGREGDDGN